MPRLAGPLPAAAAAHPGAAVVASPGCHVGPAAAHRGDLHAATLLPGYRLHEAVAAAAVHRGERLAASAASAKDGVRGGPTVLDFLRPNLRALAGYTPGEQPRAGAVIKLNTNENPYPPS